MNISHSFWLLATKHTLYDYRNLLPCNTLITEPENARHLFSQPPLQLGCWWVIQAFANASAPGSELAAADVLRWGLVRVVVLRQRHPAWGGGHDSVSGVNIQTVSGDRGAVAEVSPRNSLWDVTLGVIPDNISFKPVFQSGRDLWALQNPFDKALFILN